MLLAIHSNIDMRYVCMVNTCPRLGRGGHFVKQTVLCVHRNADSMPTGSRDVTLASLIPPWVAEHINPRSVPAEMVDFRCYNAQTLMICPPLFMIMANDRKLPIIECNPPVFHVGTVMFEPQSWFTPLIAVLFDLTAGVHITQQRLRSISCPAWPRLFASLWFP